jgi:hypothetical protein
MRLTLSAMQASSEQPTDGAPAKRGPHRWMPGTSGNPSGRARHVLADGRSVREAARDCTPEALALLTETMRNAKAPLQIRVAAAVAVLRTGHADAMRDVVATEAPPVIEVVRYIERDPQPVRGVLSSPIKEHVWLPDAPPVSEVAS